MDNMMRKQGMTSDQLLMVQGEVDDKKKNSGTAYLLWFFTGGIGGHRFYMGDTLYALGMLCTLGGLGVWTLIDLFFIGGRIRTINQKIEKEAIETVKLYAGASKATEQAEKLTEQPKIGME